MDESGRVVGVVSSVAEVDNFYAETGTLPQNVSWGVKAERAWDLLEPVAPAGLVSGRDEAIARTRDALCRVEVTGLAE